MTFFLCVDRNQMFRSCVFFYSSEYLINITQNFEPVHWFIFNLLQGNWHLNDRMYASFCEGK